jgi:hypothetical protein
MIIMKKELISNLSEPSISETLLQPDEGKHRFLLLLFQNKSFTGIETESSSRLFGCMCTI